MPWTWGWAGAGIVHLEIGKPRGLLLLSETTLQEGREKLGPGVLLVLGGDIQLPTEAWRCTGGGQAVLDQAGTSKIQIKVIKKKPSHDGSRTLDAERLWDVSSWIFSTRLEG